MKTKHIFKIFTIITMLMLAIFTTGCESQQEKYIKASNEIATFKKEWYQNSEAKADKIMAIKTNNNAEKIEKCKKYLKQYDEDCKQYEKTMKEKLENLQKIAKGNPELEKDVRLKWDEFNQANNNSAITKTNMENLIKKLENILK